jgi:pimeloyl-ACP methyl ester carboxylesterase
VEIIVLILTTFLTIVLLAIVAFAIWAGSARKPQIEALEAMKSNDLVDAKADRWLVFCPKEKEPKVGFILYPGARVDARAYSPAAQAIAAKGYLVVIVPMPLNLAGFAINRASRVINSFPHIVDWTIGGHSHGGAMAARFAYNNPAIVKGLVLWSSYPASKNDFSAKDVPVVSIYETLDGQSVMKSIDSYRNRLPAHTRWMPIEGGCHAQFGWYGLQKNENVPTISHEEQQELINTATLDLLTQVENRKKHRV